MKTRTSPLISLYRLLAAFIITVLISGCADDNPSSLEESGKVAITDMTGRSVMIPRPEEIKRAAILTSPQVLAAYAIGVQDKLCGITNAVKNREMLTRLDPHIKDVPAVRTQAGQVNIEALLQTAPDIVIGSETDMQPVEKSTGLPALRINIAPANGSIDQTREEIRFFGRVFGRTDRAEAYNAYMDNMLSMIKNALSDMPPEKRLRIFMGFNTDHLITYGGDTFMDEFIRAAGCVNAADEISSLGGKEGGQVTVSMEQVLSWDPDIVIIDSGNPDELYSDPSWSRLKASANRRIYRIPAGLFIWTRVSCEASVMLPEWLAVTAYPDRLGRLDLNKEIKRFYADIFRFNLADSDIHNILFPSQERK